MVDIPINDVTPRNRYIATAGQSVFDYDFPIFDADHIRVQETDPLNLNAPLTLVRGVDYNVTGVGAETGGTIVLLVGEYPTGAAEDDIYTLTRVLPYERLNDYQFSGDFESSDVNNDFDVLEMQIQQLNRLLLATARLDDTDELTELPIRIETAARRSKRALIFNEDGDALETGPTSTDLEGISGIIPQIEIVAANISSVNTTATNIANVNIVAANIGSVNTVAGAIANVNIVAGISAAVSAVAAIDDEVVIVAGISLDVSTVSSIAAAVVTVAANDANISIVSTNIADVNTVAANISDIQDVADALAAALASGISYSNTNSEMLATNVQAAIDELSGGDEYILAANTGTSYAINFASARNFNLTLTGNVTFTFTNPPARSGGFTLQLSQDGTGGRTVTWPASVKWPGGVAPTIPSTASSKNVLVFWTPDAGTTWNGFLCGASIA